MGIHVYGGRDKQRERASEREIGRMIESKYFNEEWWMMVVEVFNTVYHVLIEHCLFVHSFNLLYTDHLTIIY